MASKIRQNLHERTEECLNEQINWAVFASYTYLSMIAYYDRDDVASHGFKAYFMKVQKDKYKQFCKLVNYLNRRGGRVILKQVDKPSNDEWGSGPEGLTTALDMEKKLNQLYLDLHKEGEKNGDPDLCHFLEEEFLEEQRDGLKVVGDYIQQCKKAGAGLGEWHVDKLLLKKYA